MPSKLPRLYAPVSVAGVRGGTPLTLDGAIGLLQDIEAERDRAEARYYRAFDRYESVKTRAAKDRWRAKMEAERGPFVRLARAAERLDNQVQEYLDALEPEEDVEPEWQFGLDYKAARRGGHDVDINIDIRRTDGEPFSESEARDALETRLRTGRFPRGYEIFGIQYRSPDSRKVSSRRFRTGGHSVDTLEDSFEAIIDSTRVTDWRAGGIEE